MKIRRITAISIGGYIVDKDSNFLVDEQNNSIVYADEIRRYLLTAKKRDTNLLALS
jgi:hypothetical protein